MSVVHRTLDELVAYPPHPPRRASKTYRKTHKHLIYELDAPCWVCGIRRSQGGAMETHHFHFEWASQFGLDLKKVTADWPEITDRKSLAEWVDSEGNMLVLCLPAGSPVLTPNGYVDIADLRVGDCVTCADDVVRPVDCVSRTPFSGRLISVDGRLLTSNHPVLTSRGWLPAMSVRKGDEVGKYIRMFDKQMLGLRAIQPQVLKSIIMSDPIYVMDSLIGRQGPTQMLLHHPTMLENSASFTCLPNGSSDVSRLREVFAEQLSISDLMLSRARVETAHSTTVRTELCRTDFGFKLQEALRTTFYGKFSMGFTASDGRTGPRACGVPFRNFWVDQEKFAADQTSLFDSGFRSCFQARWSPVKQLGSSMFSGYVYDITIREFPAFVTDDLIVHNCDVHHRGKHTGIHMIDYPVWLLQRYQGPDFVFVQQPNPLRAHTPLFTEYAR